MEPSFPLSKAAAMNLLNEIADAFSWRDKPSIITDSVSLTEDEKNSLLAITQVDWRNVTADMWEKHFDALSWLSPTAFCYYLPSIYKATIEESVPNLIVTSSLVGMLDRTPNPEWWDDFFLERWPLLTINECKITQEWILWLADFRDLTFNNGGLDRALDTIDLLISKAQCKRLPPPTFR